MAKGIGCKWFGEQVEKQIEQAIGKGLDRMAAQVQEVAKQSMTDTKVDKDRDYRSKYKREGKNKPKGQKGNHGAVQPASAPYSPPAVQRGRLQKSIHIERPDPMTRKIGSRLEYALYLEVGTSKMIERPYLRPALYKVTGKVDTSIWEGLLDRS